MMNHNNPNPPGVMLYFRWNDSLRLLSDAQRGRILSAILAYGSTGEVPEFDDPFVDFAWQTIRPQVDDDRARYARVVEKRREAANRRWEQERTSAAPRRTEPSPAPRAAVSSQTRRVPGMPGSVLDPNAERMNRWL